MAAQAITAVPTPSRKTLLEWIDTDEGDEISFAQISGSVHWTRQQRFHAEFAFAPDDGAGEPLAPPPGLALAPLG